jgi:hypothetical protein
MQPLDLLLVQTIHRERLAEAERLRTVRRLRAQRKARRPQTRRLRLPLVGRQTDGRLA